MSVRFDEEQVGRAREIVVAGPICDECLGRAFARVGHGVSNAERGRTLRSILSEDEPTARCWVCGGLFDTIERWVDRAVRHAERYEFRTYLFGVRLTPRLEETERYFAQRFPSGDGESLKHAFNRTVGIAFERRLDHPATVDFRGPHLSFVIDLAEDRVEMHVASLYLYGRYRKLVRGIPQTRWPCRRCRGRGCPACGFVGKQYPESVEEWIASPVIEATEAAEGRLHGAGREDIDARMLGEGRPFVLEAVRPRRRSIDRSRLRDAVNRHATGKVEISPLNVVERKAVAQLKQLEANKRYRATIAFDHPIDAQRLDAVLTELCGEIAQRTPRRVAHRRADRIRRRRLLRAAAAMASPQRATVEFETEGGLYVKELVSGDEGRTEPSVAGRLGVGAVVVDLDVVEVVADPLADGTVSVDNSERLP